MPKWKSFSKRVGKEGKVTIPKDIRKILDIDFGDYVDIQVSKAEIP